MQLSAWLQSDTMTMETMLRFLKLYNKTIALFLGAVFLGSAMACGPRRNDVDMGDPAVLSRVKAELKSNSLFDARYLDIDCSQGTVTLSGLVDSNEKRHEMERVVRHVQGVREIINNLAVE